jgi:hypothetical protein
MSKIIRFPFTLFSALLKGCGCLLLFLCGGIWFASASIVPGVGGILLALVIILAVCAVSLGSFLR